LFDGNYLKEQAADMDLIFTTVTWIWLRTNWISSSTIKSRYVFVFQNSK